MTARDPLTGRFVKKTDAPAREEINAKVNSEFHTFEEKLTETKQWLATHHVLPDPYLDMKWRAVHNRQRWVLHNDGVSVAW